MVILGRRGVLQAAYTAPEFRALGQLDGVDIVVDPGDLVFDEAAQAYRTGSDASYELGLKLAAAEEFTGRPPRARATGEPCSGTASPPPRSWVRTGYAGCGMSATSSLVRSPHRPPGNPM
uniref:hypothetical protein n=1 Tax=Nocardia jinanensis TaxID=382504 RepID=UPI000738D45E|nr:hypothetical protein [Nocardia jinanensis]